MMASILSAITIALVTQSPQVDSTAKSDEQVLRSVSVRHLVGSMESTGPALRFGSLLERSEESHSFLTERDDRLSADWVADILLGHVKRRVPDLELECYASEPDGQIDLIGSPAVVDPLVSLLSAAEAVLAAPISVGVVLYRVEDSESGLDRRLPTRIQGDAIREMEGLTSLWEARAHCRSGEQVGLEHRRETPYVRSLNPEVAEESKAMEPDVRYAFDGLAVKLECHAIPGSSRVAVLGHATIGNLQPSMESVRIPVHGEVDLPVVENHAATFSGVAASGQALVLSFRSSVENEVDFALAITVTREQVSESISEFVSVFPHSALTTSSLSTSILPGQDEHSEFGTSIFPPGVSDGRNVAIPAARMMEFLRVSVGDAVDEGRVAMTAMGGFVFVEGSNADRETIGATLRGLHEQQLHTGAYELEVMLGAAVGRSGNDGVFEADDEGGTPDVRSWQRRVSVPLLRGRLHYVIHGVESVAIPDLYVNISPKAALLAPIVVPTFDGVLASFEAGTALGGAWTAMTVVNAVSASLTRQRESIGSPGDTVMLMSTSRHSQLAHEGRVLDADFVELGDVGIAAVGRSARRLGARYRVRGLD